LHCSGGNVQLLARFEISTTSELTCRLSAQFPRTSWN
jgi:hypothetical protein